LTEVLAHFWKGVMRQSGQSIYLFIRIFGFKIVPAETYKLTVTVLLCYMSNTFDENLHEHINHELADDAGRESDTS